MSSLIKFINVVLHTVNSLNSDSAFLKVIKVKCVKICYQSCWLHVLHHLKRNYCFLSAFVRKKKKILSLIIIDK